MKLERLLSGVCAASIVAGLLASGCSNSSSRAKSVADQAAFDDRTATTELMSARIEGPAPKVGKSHAAASTDEADELSAPKDARPSDGSHRAGNFGSAK